MSHRTETDGLGSKTVPENAYWGVHTARAQENFAVSGLRWPGRFIIGLAWVKMACAQTNGTLKCLDERIVNAIVSACQEIIDGSLHEQFVVDPFQGGAGTSTNMNLNEVIANRGLEILGYQRGQYDQLHPLDHVNMHQSTNDVFPTGLRIAVMFELKELEQVAARLQEAFQQKEDALRDVVKVGRTQLQDAVPMTLGMGFGAYAEALARDRWRIFKCRERIKQVNLGGTAIGTGLGAPRDYIFKVASVLRNLTGLNVSRSENLIDATQNLDPFVEVSGMLKACAVNLLKISGDLRLLSSGPDAGLQEIRLAPVQAGSTIMPGKVNPVIPEMLSQVALQVIANDQVVTSAAALGALELNQFLPVLAYNILQSLKLLSNGMTTFRERCIETLEPNSAKCVEYVMGGKSIATILVPALGYAVVEKAVKYALSQKVSVAEAFVALDLVDSERIMELLAPRRMYKLGYESSDFDDLKNSSH